LFRSRVILNKDLSRKLITTHRANSDDLINIYTIKTKKAKAIYNPLSAFTQNLLDSAANKIKHLVALEESSRQYVVSTTNTITNEV